MPVLLRKHYNTPHHNSQSVVEANSDKFTLEDRHFDVQKFLRVLPELTDK
jgi:hypothetical protein